MGWATYLTTQITYSRKSYNSLYEVTSDRDTAQKALENTKKELLSLCMVTEPRKWFDGDCEGNGDPFWCVQNKFDELMEQYDEYLLEVDKLNLLISEWEHCHDKETGLGKEEPDDWKWDTAYISGDYVKTDKHPTDNDL